MEEIKIFLSQGTQIFLFLVYPQTSKSVMSSYYYCLLKAGLSIGSSEP